MPFLLRTPMPVALLVCSVLAVLGAHPSAAGSGTAGGGRAIKRQPLRMDNSDLVDMDDAYEKRSDNFQQILDLALARKLLKQLSSQFESIDEAAMPGNGDSSHASSFSFTDDDEEKKRNYDGEELASNHNNRDLTKRGRYLFSRLVGQYRNNNLSSKEDEQLAMSKRRYLRSRRSQKANAAAPPASQHQ